MTTRGSRSCSAAFGTLDESSLAFMIGAMSAIQTARFIRAMTLWHLQQVLRPQLPRWVDNEHLLQVGRRRNFPSAIAPSRPPHISRATLIFVTENDPLALLASMWTFADQVRKESSRSHRKHPLWRASVRLHRSRQSDHVLGVTRTHAPTYWRHITVFCRTCGPEGGLLTAHAPARHTDQEGERCVRRRGRAGKEAACCRD